MKYCSTCKAELEWSIPPGDKLHRYICPTCHKIHYTNPKLIVGSLPIWENNKVLLCRRAIEPRHGFWTLPSGFMENKESAQEGAIRETREEANADISIQYLHTLYNIPHINQVYLLFKAILVKPDFSPGPESLEVRLFTKEEISWDEIAFTSIKYCLRRFFEDLQHYNSSQKTHCGCFGEI